MSGNDSGYETDSGSESQPETTIMGTRNSTEAATMAHTTVKTSSRSSNAAASTQLGAITRKRKHDDHEEETGSCKSMCKSLFTGGK